MGGLGDVSCRLRMAPEGQIPPVIGHPWGLQTVACRLGERGEVPASTLETLRLARFRLPSKHIHTLAVSRGAERGTWADGDA